MVQKSQFIAGIYYGVPKKNNAVIILFLLILKDMVYIAL